jgi:hypothetical protein
MSTQDFEKLKASIEVLSNEQLREILKIVYPKLTSIDHLSIIPKLNEEIRTGQKFVPLSAQDLESFGA